MTTAPNRKIFCDYHEGMFACEPWTGLNTDTPRDRVAREAVMFHESGHAVVQYALGLGCSAISLMITKVMRNGNELSYCHGSCASNRVTVRGIVSRIARGNINAGVLAHGIATAAGPAAERKYYLSQGLPFRMLSSTEADRNDIDVLIESWRRQAEIDLLTGDWYGDGRSWRSRTKSFGMRSKKWQTR